MSVALGLGWDTEMRSVFEAFPKNFAPFSSCHFVDSPKAVRKACRFRERSRRLWLRLLRFGLILSEGEVDVVVFRLASDTETACLEAGKQNSNQLSKACRVQHCDPFSGAS